MCLFPVLYSYFCSSSIPPGNDSLFKQSQIGIACIRPCVPMHNFAFKWKASYGPNFWQCEITFPPLPLPFTEKIQAALFLKIAQEEATIIFKTNTFWVNDESDKQDWQVIVCLWEVYIFHQNSIRRRRKEDPYMTDVLWIWTIEIFSFIKIVCGIMLGKYTNKVTEYVWFHSGKVIVTHEPEDITVNQMKWVRT